MISSIYYFEVVNRKSENGKVKEYCVIFHGNQFLSVFCRWFGSDNNELPLCWFFFFPLSRFLLVFSFFGFVASYCAQWSPLYFIVCLLNLLCEALSCDASVLQCSSHNFQMTCLLLFFRVRNQKVCPLILL